MLLVFVLMVAPAAASLRLTTRIGPGLALAVTLALAETWVGIALAYATDWPTTFWIVIVSCLIYFASAIKRTTRST